MQKVALLRQTAVYIFDRGDFGRSDFKFWPINSFKRVIFIPKSAYLKKNLGVGTEAISYCQAATTPVTVLERCAFNCHSDVHRSSPRYSLFVIVQRVYNFARPRILYPTRIINLNSTVLRFVLDFFLRLVAQQDRQVLPAGSRGIMHTKTNKNSHDFDLTY